MKLPDALQSLTDALQKLPEVPGSAKQENLVLAFVRTRISTITQAPEAPIESQRPSQKLPEVLQSLWELLERSCLVDSGNGRSYQRQSQIFAFGAPRNFWKPLEGVHPK